eukprot:CAMPEP_0177388452 /NCGR_PEP_ID=MMETSP0368-20130122/51979_1 /TAXON_ID=447022 ORGANISM="Scrippsiella hangoei-like, Strain SHHI-4" /NCGR_SAMPLE_ID=MMETSP0368 /ASSEMBLY_ACC=CAM_ASM_000363 /LENGTH=39 /DNA_ID= /DNA_START= /DNA_END= /DNA_ORIENTATION=
MFGLPSCGAGFEVPSTPGTGVPCTTCVITTCPIGSAEAP